MLLLKQDDLILFFFDVLLLYLELVSNLVLHSKVLITLHIEAIFHLNQLSLCLLLVDLIFCLNICQSIRNIFQILCQFLDCVSLLLRPFVDQVRLLELVI